MREKNKDQVAESTEDAIKPVKTSMTSTTEGDVQSNVEDNSESDEKAKKPEKKEESAADLLGANIEQVKIRKAKGSKNITSGICYVVATFNNTKVSFTDMKGNVISWSS